MKGGDIGAPIGFQFLRAEFCAHAVDNDLRAFGRFLLRLHKARIMPVFVRKREIILPRRHIENIARAALAGEHGFERIAAETAPDNLASQRGMSKGGMKLLGRMDLVVVLNVLVLRLRRPKGFKPAAFCLR